MSATERPAQPRDDASSAPPTSRRAGLGGPAARGAGAQLSAAERARFAELVEQRRDHLIRIARKGIARFLRARVSEEDVVQDTMAKVLPAIAGSHRDLLADPQQFECYFVTALQNHLKELHTTHGRLCRDAHRERSLADMGSTSFEPCAPSTRSPSRTAARKEAAHKLRREVDDLGAVDREIVIGRTVDDKSYPELGRELGLTSDAARKRFTRAWARMAPRVRAWLGLARNVDGDRGKDQA